MSRETVKIIRVYDDEDTENEELAEWAMSDYPRQHEQVVVDGEQYNVRYVRYVGGFGSDLSDEMHAPSTGVEVPVVEVLVGY